MAEPDKPFTVEQFQAGDGYIWRYRRYCVSGTPWARLVAIHGIQSHGGWYEYSSTRLAKSGIAVAFLDRRGAGMNERDRGDAPSFRRLLDDLAEFLRHERRSGDGSTLFLAAISWGGKLAMALQGRHPGLVDGLALVCPGIFSQRSVSLKRTFNILGARLLSPGRLFPIPLNDPALFTANPRWRRFIEQDPLSLRQATARLLVENVRLNGYVRLFRPRIRVPALLMLAGQDRIIRNAPTRRFVERVADDDKEIVEYAKAYHTLEFEPEPDRYIDDLADWIKRKALRSGRAFRGAVAESLPKT